MLFNSFNYLALLTLGAGFLPQSLSKCTPPITGSPRSTVGAIRWDVWIPNRDTFHAPRWNKESLAPSQWSYRLPFYAKTDGARIDIDATGRMGSMSSDAVGQAEQLMEDHGGARLHNFARRTNPVRSRAMAEPGAQSAQGFGTA